MAHNVLTYTTLHLRLLGVLAVCICFMLPLHAGRRDRIRTKKQQIAMLEQDTQASIEEQLRIPQSTQPIQESPSIELVQEEEIPFIEPVKTQEQLIHTQSVPVEVPDEIELYFENANLQNFVQQIEDIFDIVFITDDALDPLPQGAKSLKGNKISYRTIKPISRTQVWNTFNTFLNIAGFTVIPHTNDRTYRIAPIATAQKSPLNTYIGVDAVTLPDTDELVRYVYFIENNTVDTIRAVVEQFRSTASTAVYLNEHKGFILTDISYNIKKLMEIIKELDKISMPESLSVLKLKRADAKNVKELYDTLTQKEQDQRFGPRPPMNRRSPDALALPENITIIAEPRTNSLILLGPQSARERIEQFIIKNVDVELDQAYSPLHTYQVQYANAETIAKIMNDVVKFGEDTDAGRSGGVRGGDQYLRPISFIAEPATNRLVIKGHYEDYIKALDVIKKLDVDQPQVAIEVLILSVDIGKTKQLGAQIRSKAENGTDGLLGPNIKFQTSGLFAKGAMSPSSIEQKTTADSPGVKRLLGNLINTVVGATAGNTIITLGEDLCGVWGIVQLLETVSNVQLVSNPFIIATNNAPAEVSLGETRRVATATSIAASSNQDNLSGFGDDSADLIVKVTPHINSDGMIVLDLDITIDNFTSAEQNNPTKNTKNIKTYATLANKQVLALGGLVRNVISNSMSKVPLLGDIPLLGWFFKNKSKVEQKQNLLILVSTRIIEPTNPADLALYNKKHTDEYRNTVDELITVSEQRDPIHRVFFEPGVNSTERMVDEFLFNRKNGGGNARMKRIKKKKAETLARNQAMQQLHAHQEPIKVVTHKPQAITSTRLQPVPHKHMTVAAAKTEQPKVSSMPKTTIAPVESHKNQELKTALQHKKRSNLAFTELLPRETQGARA